MDLLPFLPQPVVSQAVNVLVGTCDPDCLSLLHIRGQVSKLLRLFYTWVSVYTLFPKGCKMRIGDEVGQLKDDRSV